MLLTSLMSSTHPLTATTPKTVSPGRGVSTWPNADCAEAAAEWRHRATTSPRANLRIFILQKRGLRITGNLAALSGRSLGKSREKRDSGFSCVLESGMENRRRAKMLLSIALAAALLAYFLSRANLADVARKLAHVRPGYFLLAVGS